MAQAVSRWHLTGEARDLFQVSPRDVCGGRSGKGTGFFRVLLFSSVTIIAPMLHIYLHLHVTLTKRKKGEVWKP